MPVFLQAAPGMSLGQEFDAPSKRLELSSAVKVKTHQFLSKSHCVLDLSVCRERRRRRRRWEGKASAGACRIRPLGVTVLSRIRPVNKHPHKHCKQNGVTSGQLLFKNAALGSVVAAQRAPCAPTYSPLQGWVINGRSNNLRVVHKIIFLSEAMCHIPTSSAAATSLICFFFFNSCTHCWRLHSDRGMALQMGRSKGAPATND